ncbi:hypothetical protein XthCFBP4691_19770 [Xanthomonas theicola]|uniref:Uncharacterized protein n=1 Tax=Xanthomonas theicola TaxID=56464 RepID=A0A2S6Z2V2_9XANT|nr:hypothetical protein XthCFBP4691_19770 [Xanthomonas theicola]
MMAAHSLRFIVLSGVSACWPLPCRRACRASASALHFALPSHVQASCLERARPAAVSAFAGALAAHAAAQPGRRSRERQRKATAEGKTKGRGTWPRRKAVCTWRKHGTQRLCRRAVLSAKRAPMHACPRASHDRTRPNLRGAQS